MVIKIETYHQTNILTKLNLTFRNIIIDLQNSDSWKNQLKIAIKFIFSKDAEEERVIHSRSNKKNLHLIMIQMKLLMNSQSHFVQDVKEI